MTGALRRRRAALWLLALWVAGCVAPGDPDQVGRHAGDVSVALKGSPNAAAATAGVRPVRPAVAGAPVAPPSPASADLLQRYEVELVCRPRPRVCD